ncbi:DUF7716 domain-containing protein [Taylorella equigenitalis]|uniref:DUF7716 domain-containing protein n=1 Tax=Taylorella equigenitalis TaxID=29575 RepID=UPI00237CA654|nr:hypothetical protein [Taylorella equigenitalis]WDU45842.1 hypothetical protein KNO33_04785 [Taylorella equigenitalis]
MAELAVKYESRLDELGFYTTDNSNLFSLKDKYFLDELPDLDDDDIEIYPEATVSQNLSLILQGYLFVDIVINYINQVESLNSEELVDSINYYLKNDELKDII